MNIKQKLMHIQNELKAPKNQYNDFGKYNYRNCEDILEAVKPICMKYNTTVIIGDEIVIIGDRYFVKATVKLLDCESDDFLYTTAFAREEANKKGMDASQVTGATSSYARKYALNGLFNIDDTKDADTDEHTLSIISAKEKEAKQCGIDLNNIKVVEFIDKYNNGKHNPKEMNAKEIQGYMACLDTLIKNKKNASNSK